MNRILAISFYFSLMVVSVSFTSCWQNSGSVRFKPARMEALQEREVACFNKIELDGNFTVYIQNADTCRVSVEGEEDILNTVITESDHETLRIGYMNEQMMPMDHSVVLHIMVRDLHAIKGQKSLKIFSTDIFEFRELNLNFAGAVDLEMEMAGRQLEGIFAGASSVDLQGKVDVIKLEMPGAGKFNAFDLEVRDADLNLAGAGTAEVNVTGELRVNMAGACYVSYKGNPENVYSNISGIGRLKKVD